MTKHFVASTWLPSTQHATSPLSLSYQVLGGGEKGEDLELANPLLRRQTGVRFASRTGPMPALDADAGNSKDHERKKTIPKENDEQRSPHVA